MKDTSLTLLLSQKQNRIKQTPHKVFPLVYINPVRFRDNQDSTRLQLWCSYFHHFLYPFTDILWTLMGDLCLIYIGVELKGNRPRVLINTVQNDLIYCYTCVKISENTQNLPQTCLLYGHLCSKIMDLPVFLLELCQTFRIYKTCIKSTSSQRVPFTQILHHFQQID